MSEYDNTNRGAAFPPFPTQSMILQGKLNVEGNEEKVVLVKDETRSGKQIIEVFAKVGVLFQNDKRGNEGAPDYSGNLELRYFNAEKRIAGWKKVGNDKPFLSLSVSDPQNSGAGKAQQSLANDDIPF